MSDRKPTDHFWLFEQLSDEQIDKVRARTNRVTVQPNEIICAEGDPGDCMYIMLSGRVKITAAADSGREVALNVLDIGDHFGELSILTGQPRAATATAIVTSDLLELGREDFLYFLHHMPKFAANVSRTISRWLQNQAAGQRPQPIQSVALFRFASLSDRLAFDLVELWRPGCHWMTVVTDREDEWDRWLSRLTAEQLASRGIGLVPFGGGEKVRIPATSEEHKVLIDLAGFSGADKAIDKAERVWIATSPDCVEAAISSLKNVAMRHEHLERRLRFLWCYEQVARPPVELTSPSLAMHSTASLPCSSNSAGRHSVSAAGTQRLLRNLHGIDVGLALGGGGGRGLAHLGVLQAFDDHGIQFDRIAGTSVGALAAIFYGAGISPRRTLESVTGDMQPPRWIRWIPKHKQWFMLLAFRFGYLEKRFRSYLEDITLQEMFSPTYTVCVDLVRGSEVIRDRGDAVHAALESINHPGMGRPIMRGGEALVDGGVLINLPANVLRERGCEFVVAVDIGSQLEAKFAGNTPATPADRMRRPGYLETLFRTTEVQMCNLANIHAAESDFLIQPDTSSFPFEDFTAGNELYETGYEAAVKAIPDLSAELEKLMGIG